MTSTHPCARNLRKQIISLAGLPQSAISRGFAAPAAAAASKIRVFGANNRSPNRAFAGPSNRLPDALKNTRKIPFIQ
jgi:hypothetical protein